MLRIQGLGVLFNQSLLLLFALESHVIDDLLFSCNEVKLGLFSLLEKLSLAVGFLFDEVVMELSLLVD